MNLQSTSFFHAVGWSSPVRGKYRSGRRRREYRADKERFVRDRVEFEASTARALTLREIMRLYDEAGKGGRDAALALRVRGRGKTARYTLLPVRRLIEHSGAQIHVNELCMTSR